MVLRNHLGSSFHWLEPVSVSVVDTVAPVESVDHRPDWIALRLCLMTDDELFVDRPRRVPVCAKRVHKWMGMVD